MSGPAARLAALVLVLAAGAFASACVAPGPEPGTLAARLVPVRRALVAARPLQGAPVDGALCDAAARGLARELGRYGFSYALKRPMPAIEVLRVVPSSERAALEALAEELAADHIVLVELARLELDGERVTFGGRCVLRASGEGSGLEELAWEYAGAEAGGWLTAHLPAARDAALEEVALRWGRALPAALANDDPERSQGGP